MSGEEFKKLRVRMGLTQKKVSAMVDLTITAISNFERGESTPHRKNLEKLTKLVSNG